MHLCGLAVGNTLAVRLRVKLRLFAGKLVNVPLEQLPLLFKAVLHSCKSSLSSYRSGLSPCVTTSSGN